MNERIEELAISSGIYDSLCDPYDALKNGDYYSSIKIDLEKFAELIVRKCADVAKETRWAVPPSQEQIARGIQQHFGVEE